MTKGIYFRSCIMTDTPFNKIRVKYPNAYERWTESDDSLLQEKRIAGASIGELAKFFQRQPGAISSRLRKLNGKATPSAENTPQDRVQIGFVFEWRAVLRSAAEEYHYPEPITPFMKRMYNRPAVYRWNVYQNVPANQQKIYIGQASRLCPDRIEGYLNPRPSESTNNRLRREFQKCLTQGLRIRLEVLHFDRLAIGDLTLTAAELGEQSFRIFIESLLITYYKRSRVTLLNA